SLDKRADIWAFGCVLYELLTGMHAFAGETVSDTLAAILDRDPDWTTLPDTTPRNIQRLLRHCLEKDLKLRLRHIRHPRLEINEALAPSVSDRSTATPVPVPSAPQRTMPVAAAAVLGATLTLVFALVLRWWAGPQGTPPPSTRVSVELGTDASLVTDQFG